jgi:hypothetical protein
MAAPMKGIWAARFSQPYTGALAWGTGINPVHAYYGSDPARESPLRPMQGMPIDMPDHTPPHEGVPQATYPGYQWGYQPEDSTYTTLETDNRPSWDVETPDMVTRSAPNQIPPLNATGAAKNRFRDLFGGAFQTWRAKLPRGTYMVPTETVSEGWLNKPNFGEVAKGKPSAWGQYERQTSMQQRFQTRTNQLAVMRNTDEPREPIASRVQPQRSPVYSGDRRHYDMFPKQQTPDTEREFYYRTAGTGQPEWMTNNETYDISALERTPPPDPYIGTADTSSQLEYGYTQEDYFYA